MKTCETCRLKFPDMDKQQLMEKLSEIKTEADNLTLLGRKFGIHIQVERTVSIAIEDILRLAGSQRRN